MRYEFAYRYLRSDEKVERCCLSRVYHKSIVDTYRTW